MWGTSLLEVERSLVLVPLESKTSSAQGALLAATVRITSLRISPPREFLRLLLKSLISAGKLFHPGGGIHCLLQRKIMSKWWSKKILILIRSNFKIKVISLLFLIFLNKLRECDNTLLLLACLFLPCPPLQTSQTGFECLPLEDANDNLSN